jgi:hypothetical protein
MSRIRNGIYIGIPMLFMAAIVEPQSEVTLYDFEFRQKIYYTNPMLTSQQ